MSRIPQNIEVLIRKAAVDDDFRELLIDGRTAAAEAIGLALEPAEAMMLGSVPAAQLQKIIAETSVPQEHRRTFLGHAAAAMLAAMATMGGTVEAGGKMMSGSGGMMSDRPPQRVDTVGPPGGTFGIQPDRPHVREVPSKAERVRQIVIKHFNANRALKLEADFAKDLRATLMQMRTLEDVINREFEITLSAEAFWRSQTVKDLGIAVDLAIRQKDEARAR
jgi:hypothetical protein